MGMSNTTVTHEPRMSLQDKTDTLVRIISKSESVAESEILEALYSEVFIRCNRVVSSMAEVQAHGYLPTAFEILSDRAKG